MNNIFIQALKGKNFTNEIPIWFLRQSGRYLPDYQKIREKYKFKDLITTPELIVELTLLPFKYIDLDAAIIFSDISLIYEIVDGIDYNIVDNVGPIVKLKKDIKDLKIIDPQEKLFFLKQAVIDIKSNLKKPLIGFSPGFFTMLSYLFKNNDSKKKEPIIKEFFYSKDWEDIISFFYRVLLEYINFLGKLNFEAIQIFDSFLFELSKFEFNYYLKNYYVNLLNELKKKIRIPFIFFCLDTIYIVDFIKELNIDVLSVDHKENILFYFNNIRDKTIQGNLDPFILTLDYKIFKFILERSFKDILENIKLEKDYKRRYIFNVGYGLKPNTQIDNLKFLIEYIKK